MKLDRSDDVAGPAEGITLLQSSKSRQTVVQKLSRRQGLADPKVPFGEGNDTRTTANGPLKRHLLVFTCRQTNGTTWM